MSQRTDFSRSHKARTFCGTLLLWTLVGSLLLGRLPMWQNDPPPTLYTVRQESYPLCATLSFLCFGCAVPLYCEGRVLAAERGKVACGETLLLGYGGAGSQVLSFISALQAGAEGTAPTKDELASLLCLYRQGDEQAGCAFLQATGRICPPQKKAQAAAALIKAGESLPAPLFTVKAEADGWFTPFCDGFEALDRTDPHALTAKDVRQWRDRGQQPPAQGKLYTSPYWYAAAAVSKETADLFEAQRTYELPYGAGQTLSAVLVKKQQGQEVLLLFEIYGIPEGGIRRTFTATVTYATLQGLRIPKAALLELPQTWAVRVYAGQAVWLRSVSLVADCGRFVFVKGGAVVKGQGEPTLYPLKENESIYLDNSF